MSNPHDHQSIGSKNALTMAALEAFLKWFDRHEHGWSNETRESNEFYDLQEIVDRAREALS